MSEMKDAAFKRQRFLFIPSLPRHLSGAEAARGADTRQVRAGTARAPAGYSTAHVCTPPALPHVIAAGSGPKAAQSCRLSDGAGTVRRLSSHAAVRCRCAVSVAERSFFLAAESRLRAAIVAAAQVAARARCRQSAPLRHAQASRSRRTAAHSHGAAEQEQRQGMR